MTTTLTASKNLLDHMISNKRTADAYWRQFNENMFVYEGYRHRIMEERARLSLKEISDSGILEDRLDIPECPMVRYIVSGEAFIMGINHY